MMPEVTYQDYVKSGGLLDEEAFMQCLSHALSAVRDLIGFNVPETQFQITAYKKAVCAAIDVDHAHGGTGGLNDGGPSFTIGAYSSSGSYSSSQAAMDSYDADMLRVLHPILVRTGLLYQVIL